MPGASRRSIRLPVYRLHKPSGQARIRLNGAEMYLGRHNSPESLRRFADILQRLQTGDVLDLADAARKQAAQAAADGAGLTVNELSVLFLEWAVGHYQKRGKVTDEYHCFVSAIAPLKKLHGLTACKDFGPLALKAVRDAMIAKAWTRKYINKSINRIRRIFAFGVENELVDVAVLQRLKAVSPLLAGRTEAKDRPTRKPVSPENVEAVRALVKERYRDLIDLQLATGARPGELLMLTTGMIDRTGEIWVADLDDHKTAHCDKLRRLCFGPRAQLILRKYLTADPAARLFPFRRESYCCAVRRACRDADVPVWTPHWLRHNVATEIRDTFGVEAAQAVLGHSTPDMTAKYSSQTAALALETVRKRG